MQIIVWVFWLILQWVDVYAFCLLFSYLIKVVALLYFICCYQHVLVNKDIQKLETYRIDIQSPPPAAAAAAHLMHNRATVAVTYSTGRSTRAFIITVWPWPLTFWLHFLCTASGCHGLRYKDQQVLTTHRELRSGGGGGKVCYLRLPCWSLLSITVIYSRHLVVVLATYFAQLCRCSWTVQICMGVSGTSEYLCVYVCLAFNAT